MASSVLATWPSSHLSINVRNTFTLGKCLVYISMGLTPRLHNILMLVNVMIYVVHLLIHFESGGSMVKNCWHPAKNGIGFNTTSNVKI